MSGIGERLREERERLGISQAVFGELGGVKANAQGNYEKGERYPDAQYLAAVAQRGVDILYVVTGNRQPLDTEQISSEVTEIVRLTTLMESTDIEILRRTAEAFVKARV